MSQSDDLATGLRNAVAAVRETSPPASEHLARHAAEAATAVADVTGGKLRLDLVVVNQPEGAVPAFQLILRKVGSEAPPSDLGIYALSPEGFPVRRWYSRPKWEAEPDKPSKEYTPDTLKEHFRWMLTNPESRLVILVTYLDPAAAAGTSTAGAKKPKGGKPTPR